MNESVFALRVLYRDPGLDERIELFGWTGLDLPGLAERWAQFFEAVDCGICAEAWQGRHLLDTLSISRRTVERIRDESFDDVVRGAREARARDAEHRGKHPRANRIRAVIRAAKPS